MERVGDGGAGGVRRFWVKVFAWGVEACCREDKFGKVIKNWEEEGRKFRLELRANGAGRYILCSVRDLEAKRFSLVFPEGRGLIGGWVLLAEKLRSLGIHLLAENKAVRRSRKSVAKRKPTCSGQTFQLERWGPEAGCFRHGVHTNLCWVRAVGLPLNFWNREVFRKLGDSCGGLVAVDEDTTNFSQLQWARILVKSDGKDLPGALNLVVGSLCFAIQLWWEVPPWVSVTGTGARKGEVAGQK
ncbi:hypothetical protein CK203_002339 [Vitis vinifera]|uniref:Uncharacterized protein n=1 Tax=Vitis vinifera TaxID=29760 RepID=A0A438KK37_VITVI|nr:hypothetical protein CK203_002339 [Vitis vinifera]